MWKSTFGTLLLSGIVAFLTVSLGANADRPSPAQEQVFELRTYITHPGKLDDLHRRFEDHTLDLFTKHGMTNVGYWVPEDEDNTLIYIVAHASREAAEASWESFINDPEWQEVSEASNADGPILREIESVFMTATDYSEIR